MDGSGRVFIVTWLINASVPSEPTSKWAIMSNGSSNLMKGNMLSPVTFFIEYLYLMRSERSLSARIPSLSSSIPLMKSGWLALKASLEVSSPVSSTVPSAKTIRTLSSSLSLLAWVPQLIPEALFITIPPTIQLPIEAGSGPNFRP